MRLDERLLRQLLGSGALADDAGDEADDRALVAADDLLECGLRAGQCVGNQARLGYRLQVYRDGSVPLRQSYVAVPGDVAAAGFGR